MGFGMYVENVSMRTVPADTLTHFICSMSGVIHFHSVATLERIAAALGGELSVSITVPVNG